jgi:hypothetical protein
MKSATSLTVIAIGAIFAFAITASPSFLNLQVVGWILMLTGTAGLLMSYRNKSWLRRTVTVKGTSNGPRSPRRRPVRQIQPSAAAKRQPAGYETQPIEREVVDEYSEQ